MSCAQVRLYRTQMTYGGVRLYRRSVTDARYLAFSTLADQRSKNAFASASLSKKVTKLPTMTFQGKDVTVKSAVNTSSTLFTNAALILSALVKDGVGTGKSNSFGMFRTQTRTVCGMTRLIHPLH